MGAKSADIEREIAEQRRRISRRFEDLEVRLQDDLKGVGNRVKGEVSQVGEEPPELVKRLQAQMRQRPGTVLSGALGAGVLLGALSEGFGSGREDGYRDDRTRWEEDGRSGQSRRDTHGEQSSPLMGRALGFLTASVMDPARDEIERMTREALGGFSRSARRREVEEDLRDMEGEGRQREQAATQGNGYR